MSVCVMFRDCIMFSSYQECCQSLILILLPTLVLFNKSKWQTLHQVRKLNTLPAIKVASSFIVIFPSLVQQTNIARQTADTDTVPNMPRQSKYQAATKRSSDTRRPGRAERSVTVTSLKYFQMRNPVRCTNTNPGVWNKNSKQYLQKSINISIITDNVMLWPWLIQQDLYSRAFLWKRHQSYTSSKKYVLFVQRFRNLPPVELIIILALSLFVLHINWCC